MHPTPLPPIEYIDPASDLGTSLRKVWGKNIAALVAPDGYRFVQGCPDPLAAGRLFRDARHHYGISSPAPDESNSTEQLLTDFSLAEDIQSQFLDLINYSGSETVFFLGAGIGEPLLAILSFLTERTTAVAGTRKIHLIEPDPGRLQSAFYFFDYSAVLSSSLFRLHSGPDWLESLEGELLINAPPSGILAVHPVFANHKVCNEIAELFRKRDIRLDIRTIRKTRPAEVLDGPAGYPIALGTSATLENLKRKFRKNLDLLRSSTDFHCSAGFLERVENCRLDVIRDRGGRIHFPLTQPGSPPQSLALTPDEREMRHYDKALSEQNTVECTWLQLGCGDGSLLELLIRKTVFTGQWEGYQQIIYLIEPHAFLFAGFLHFFDLEEVFGLGRLKIFAGEEAQSLLTEYLRDVPESRIPDRFILSPHFLAEELEKYKISISKLQEEIAREAQELSRKLAEQYDLRPLSYWQKRFNGGKPLTIVGLTTRMSSYVQYCLKDLLDGFAQNGHKVSLLTEKDALSALRFNDVLRSLVALKPDLLCVIGHLRQEFRLLPTNFPYFCWLQDMLPTISTYLGFTLTPWDHIYSFNRIWAEGLKHQNRTFADTSIGLLPVGFNDTHFHPLPGRPQQYDVTYISHLFDPSKTFAFFRDGTSPLVLDSIEQELLASGELTYGELMDLYQIIAQALALRDLNELTGYVTNAAQFRRGSFLTDLPDSAITTRIPEKLYRHFCDGHSRLFYDAMVLTKTRPIEILQTAGFRVAAWGNNWEKQARFQKVSHGVARNDQVNIIQNESAINLNNSGGVSFHMKAIEILASRNFMLSRFIQEDGHPLTDYFRRDEEVVFFNDENDLLEKVRYYLEHPEERTRIAGNAYNKALAMFSYRGLTKKIAGDISKRISKMQSKPKQKV